MHKLTVLMLLAVVAGCGGGSGSAGGSASPTPAASPSPSPATSPSPAPAAATLAWRGVSLAGAEFGEGNLPGTYGSTYVYPTAASVAYFKAKGMNVARLPFRWERLQPTLMQAFDAAELARLHGFIDAVTATGVTVILDPHNYARWHGNLIGSSAVPNAAFADFWARLAGEFKANTKVAFGLMNEPNTMPTEQWLAGANAALAAIRSAGATNLVTVPGNAWSGAHSWAQNWYGTSNATTMKGIVDPGGNMVFEVHQYLDADSSGTSANCVSETIGVERVQTFTTWLRSNGYRALLGEFAGGANTTCNAAVTNLLAHLEANADVWQGWTWWAAGPWWGSYMFSIEPDGTTDKPQMATLAAYLTSSSGTGSTTTPLSTVRSGEGTFYGATGAGNCSFDATPQDLMVAAMNASDYAGAAACGEYVTVTGPRGSVTVRIVDQCPECQSGDIDLSAEAFALIAEPSAGRVPISWQIVTGDVQGPVAYRYKEGSSRWWTAIQVRNHRLPITALAIKPAGSADWIDVARTDYNYFVHPSEIAAGALQVRVTAQGGATLVDTLPEPTGALVVAGQAQFP